MRPAWNSHVPASERLFRYYRVNLCKHFFNRRERKVCLFAVNDQRGRKPE